jgi:hypothetical protein
MRAHPHRSTTPLRAAPPTHHAKPWQKLLTFLALLAIPALCTALYNS